MKFLPYSNGVRKVSMKKHRSPKDNFNNWDSYTKFS